MRLTRSLTLGLLLLLCTAAVQAAPDFPELTGRVVDNAELLDAPTEKELSETLAAHEKTSGEQVVVVTLPDLGGETIEQYGYQLGRAWGIGQKDKDNGALLIVALDERKVRIEVGYGLEGRLTDAQSATIINQVITPAFRDGDYVRGIVQGSQAMIQVLGGDPMARTEHRPERKSSEPNELGSAGIWLTILMFIVLMIVRGGGGGGRGGRGRGGLLGGMLLGGALGGGGRSGGGLGGGGGFSGGGGGFGGGGASGGW